MLLSVHFEENHTTLRETWVSMATLWCILTKEQSQSEIGMTSLGVDMHCTVDHKMVMKNRANVNILDLCLERL